MYYLFACFKPQVRDKMDILVLRDVTKAAAIGTARKLNACESYVMDASDNVVWESWGGRHDF